MRKEEGTWYRAGLEEDEQEKEKNQEEKEQDRNCFRICKSRNNLYILSLL